MSNLDIACCASRGLSHFQLISLGALGEWPLWSLDIKNASLQEDGSISRFTFGLHVSGIPTLLAEYGNCGRPRIGRMMPRRPSLGPCVNSC